MLLESNEEKFNFWGVTGWEVRSHPRSDVLHAPWRCVHLKDERKRKVVYHRHTDGDLEKQMRSVNWEWWCSLHDKKGAKNRVLRNAAKTGMDRRETTVTFNTERMRGHWTSQGQCQLFQTTRKNETIWSIVSNAAERSRRQRLRDMIFFESLWHSHWWGSYGEIQKSRLRLSVELCLQYGDWWGFKRLSAWLTMMKWVNCEGWYYLSVSVVS